VLLRARSVFNIFASLAKSAIMVPKSSFHFSGLTIKPLIRIWQTKIVPPHSKVVVPTLLFSANGQRTPRSRLQVTRGARQPKSGLNTTIARIRYNRNNCRVKIHTMSTSIRTSDLHVHSNCFRFEAKFLTNIHNHQSCE
jgi:hypothetical protein